MFLQGLDQNAVTYCPPTAGEDEDVKMGFCLAGLGVKPVDTRCGW